MLRVELRSAPGGEMEYRAVASIVLDVGGSLEVWDPEGVLKGDFGVLGLTVPWRGDDGKVRRLSFDENPGAWLRNLHRTLRSGDLVPVVVRDDDAGELTREDVAERLGVSVGTWAGYVSRGQAPAPTRRVGRTPVWSAASVDAWQASRRGRGRRRAASA